MSQERLFVKEGIRRMEIEEYLEKEFSRAGYSHSEVQRTPLAVRIIIFAHKPGIIIGRGGRNIDMITDVLKNRFKIENPQLDIQEVAEPDLDPHIVAKQIALGIEKGLNYKRVVNMMMQRVMEAGAVGVAFRVAGKVGGEMSRIEKFSSGYLKYAGDDADSKVKRAHTTAQLKLGTIGIGVRILVDRPEELESLEKIRSSELPKEEEANGDNKVKAD